MNVWEGSVRSGKTIASLLRFLLYVNSSTVRGELIVVSRTRDSAARNVFAPLMDRGLFGPLADQVSYTAGAPTGFILGRKVWVLGSSDVRSENVLRGLTCSGAYIDEITLLKEDFFTQLLNRLWHGARCFGTTNPDNPAHWFKVRYLDRLKRGELPDWISWKFLLDDNPQLHPEQKAAIRRENTGLYYRRNVLGEWVAAEGAVYDMWDAEENVIPWDKLPPMRRFISAGVDYGTRNASSAVLIGLGVDGVLYAVDEWRYDSRERERVLTNGELADQFAAWCAEPHAPNQPNPRIEWVHLDPAALSFRTELSRMGWNNVVEADNSVVYGIRTVGTLLAAGKLKISDRCTGLISEFPGYSWDPKATDKGEDKPIKQADHSLDAIRYAICSTETNWRPFVNTA